MAYTSEDYAKLKQELIDLSEEEYRKFHSKLVPGITDILGIRVPVLRKTAKAISKKDWQGYLEIANDDTYEEIMLQGMVIGLVKCDFEQWLNYIMLFVPKINNWAVCDVFCGGLKRTKRHLEEMRVFLQTYLESSKEYEIRFGVVMLMSYYINDDYIDDVIKILNSIKHDGYYVKMAVAWALSFCFIKQREKTLVLFKNNNLDDFTFNKSLQKCRESYRVTKEDKEMLKAMRRNSK